MSSVSIVIPARYGSTRFEGKPLALICGRPMIQHVYERARRAKVADEVIVATDDQRIVKAVEGFGKRAHITSTCHETGTQRVAEVAASLSSSWIINLQGDEPLVDPEVIDLLGHAMINSTNPDDLMFSLMRPISDHCEFLNPNVVKVVVDNAGYALYFSRAPIPFPKGLTMDNLQDAYTRSTDQMFFKNLYAHCGIYGFRRDFLLSIPLLKPSVLEHIEGLEQLRVLENGYRIKMVKTHYRSVSVDTPGDIERVEALIRQEG